MKRVKLVFVCIGALVLLSAFLNPSTGQFSEYINVRFPSQQDEQDWEQLGYKPRVYGRLKNWVIFSEFEYYNMYETRHETYYGVFGNFFRKD